jgi:hypothetical protein
MSTIFSQQLAASLATFERMPGRAPPPTINPQRVGRGTPNGENEDRVPYVNQALLAAGVCQIPDDVHQMFADWGDQADKAMSPEQVKRFEKSIARAMKNLRQLYIDHQKQLQTWDECNREVLLKEEKEPEGPVQIFVAIAGSGNFSRTRPATKFGKRRGRPRGRSLGKIGRESNHVRELDQAG